MASIPQLRIARQIGMYGTCKDIAAYVGSDQIGDAHYDHIRSEWLVSVFNQNAVISISIAGPREEGAEIVVKRFLEHFDRYFAQPTARAA